MKITIDKPNAKQELFLRERHRYVGYGGARGGGKSWSVRTKAKLLALRYPGIRLLIVRRSYPELINNHINTLRQECLGVAKYNDRDKVLRFLNGSVIDFMYCERDRDLDRLQGVEYDVIFLDEATQLSEYQMRAIAACLRGVNSFPKRMYFTCNPGGQGHAYIKRVFIDRRFENGENPEDYVFIQALVQDNKALMSAQPEYVAQLEALPGHLREMWLEGRWDVFAGQFFEDFRLEPDPKRCQAAGITPEEAKVQRRFTHVIAPFDVPRGWRIYRSYDFGYQRPFSLAWWAVDYDGTFYRILELYGCTGEPNEGVRWTPDEQFRKWAGQIVKDHTIQGWTMDVERLKKGHMFTDEYFERQLQQIREIRLSERKFYQKVTDLYATAFDYDKDAKTTRQFFRTVQNKMHFAVHRHTAAELIVERADASKEHMGLTTWENAPEGKILKADVTVAKNYLSTEEMRYLERIVSLYLDYAELQAERKIPMSMEDWAKRLDGFLEFNGNQLLTRPGKISAEQAKLHAETEYEKYRIIQDRLYESDFDRFLLLEQEVNRNDQ